MDATLSHAIPCEHRSTAAQKPHDFRVSNSKPDVPSQELHATFAGLYPLANITPDGEHYTRSEWVQCPLIGCTTRSQQAEARIHVRGSSAPANRSDTTRHVTDPSLLSRLPSTGHDIPHDGAPAIRPKCRPIEQKQPIIKEFWRMGLRFGG